MVLGFPGGEEDSMDDTCAGFSLSRTQRFYGFGICFVLGFLISILSTIMIAFNIVGFAILYTFGNIISLMSTGFLVGPMKQLKTAFNKVRVVATVVFLVSMILTLVVAFSLKNPTGLTIICCIVQFCALFWYSASYIPYARTMIKNCCGNAVSSIV